MESGTWHALSISHAQKAKCNSPNAFIELHILTFTSAFIFICFFFFAVQTQSRVFDDIAEKYAAPWRIERKTFSTNRFKWNVFLPFSINNPNFIPNLRLHRSSKSVKEKEKKKHSINKSSSTVFNAKRVDLSNFRRHCHLSRNSQIKILAIR